MAGLLDNDFARFILTGPRRYYEYKDAQSSRQDYEGLLAGLGINQQQPGAAAPGQGGLLQSRAPDQQFWLKAAAIPGYQGLAGQQLGYEAAGQQAMGRQMQQQDFELNNLTAAQAEQLAQNRLRAERDYAIDQQDLARKWYGTQASAASSYASANSSEASRALSAARLDSELLKLRREQGGLLDRLPPQNQLEVRQDLLSKDTWAQAANDAADFAENRGGLAVLPVVGTGEAGAFNVEWLTSVLPAVAQMENLGVIQEGEREALLDIIGSPAGHVLTESQLNSIKTIAQKVKDLRTNAYKAVGLEAPPLTKGGSAASRVLSRGQPQGQVRPVTSLPNQAPPGSVSGRVQRY